MKKHRSLIVIIATALIVVGVIVTSFITDFSSVISSVVTTVTAIIGAVALYLQFKKDKEVNQASFMVSFHETFYSNPTNVEILDILDEHSLDNYTNNLTDPKYYKHIMTYMGWIRTLCALIENKVLDFDAIDEIFAFKFFGFTNDKQIQDAELVSHKQFYKLIYRVHKKWLAYRKSHGKYIAFEETSLDKFKGYDEMTK